jgi:hypothetical protein
LNIRKIFKPGRAHLSASLHLLAPRRVSSDHVGCGLITWLGPLARPMIVAAAILPAPTVSPPTHVGCRLITSRVAGRAPPLPFHFHVVDLAALTPFCCPSPCLPSLATAKLFHRRSSRTRALLHRPSPLAPGCYSSH